MKKTTSNGGHICATQAVCFQCFRAGMEKVRARREAWAQRSLPFDDGAVPRATGLTARAAAHREQMLAHLAQIARQA
jgi:hypothetical protein